MKGNQSTYLMLEQSRSSRSGCSTSLPRRRFHQLRVEGCLHSTIAKSIPPRITDPINWKLSAFPMKEVNEGRSVHSSFHAISLRIVSVLFQLKGSLSIVCCSKRESPFKARSPSWMELNNGKSTSPLSPFSYSQTQPTDNMWTHCYPVWWTEAEGGLWVHFS